MNQLEIFDEQFQKRVIENNLQKSNREIAEILQTSESEIRSLQRKFNLFRSKEQVGEIRAKMNREQSGEANPNWKGGRSGNDYYYNKRSREKYPEKHAARLKVYRAVKSGKLLKQPCEICGNLKTEFHHENYLEPLNVISLCRIHHNIFDRLLKAGIKLKDFMKYYSSIALHFSMIGLKKEAA